MKKTLLALAVLTAAGSVNAATVYEKDGLSVDVGGAMEVQFRKTLADGSDLDLRQDDGELNFKATVEVAEGVDAVGYYDFEFESGDAKTTELWGGFKGDFGTITFGKQYLHGDDAVIGSDYELGFDSLDYEAHGEDVIKYKYSADNFWLGLSVDLEEGSDDESAFDAAAGVTMGDVELRAFYLNEQQDDTVNAVKFDKTLYSIEAEYSADAFGAGLGFAHSEDDVTNVENDLLSMFGSYTVGKVKYAVGLNLLDKDGEDITNYYANVTYKMNGNVRVYGEVGGADSDVSGNEYDFGYVAGLEIKF